MDLPMKTPLQALVVRIEELSLKRQSSNDRIEQGRLLQEIVCLEYALNFLREHGYD